MAAVADQKSKLLVVPPCQKKTVTLFFALLGSGLGDEKGAERQIDLPFIAKEVVVRQITVSGSGDYGDTVGCILADFLGNSQPLGTFACSIGQGLAPNTTFSLNGLESCKARFWFTEDGVVTVCGIPAKVSITLEFHA